MVLLCTLHATLLLAQWVFHFQKDQEQPHSPLTVLHKKSLLGENTEFDNKSISTAMLLLRSSLPFPLFFPFSSLSRFFLNGTVSWRKHTAEQHFN